MVYFLKDNWQLSDISRRETEREGGDSGTTVGKASKKAGTLVRSHSGAEEVGKGGGGI